MTPSIAEERAAYLEAHPDEQTAPHLIDLAREAKIVSRTLHRAPDDARLRHPLTFAGVRAALVETANAHRQDQAYFELVGIDRVWIMADALAGQAPR